MKNPKKHVSIRIYDDEGELHESIVGRMTYHDVRDVMINALKSDGIPVLRASVPAQAEPIKEPYCKPQVHKEIVEEWRGAYVKGSNAPVQERMESLLTVDWEYEGIKFHAFGAGRDVIDAQYDLLKMLADRPLIIQEK